MSLEKSEAVKVRFENFTQYAKSFPKPVSVLLKQLYQIIREEVPEAIPVISYNMPAFKLEGILVYFAGYKNHIGFYPMASTIKNFSKEMAIFKSAKGSVQFPITQPLPEPLIRKMIQFRLNENKKKAAAKKSKLIKKKH